MPGTVSTVRGVALISLVTGAVVTAGGAAAAVCVTGVRFDAGGAVFATGSGCVRTGVATGAGVTVAFSEFVVAVSVRAAPGIRKCIFTGASVCAIGWFTGAG